MKAVNRGSFPILIVSGEIGSHTLEGRRVRAIAEKLENSGFTVLKAENCTDVLSDFHTHPNLGCAVVDWNTETDMPQDFLRGIRRFSDVLPVLLMTDRFSVEKLPIGILREIDDTSGLLKTRPTSSPAGSRRLHFPTSKAYFPYSSGSLSNTPKSTVTPGTRLGIWAESHS